MISHLALFLCTLIAMEGVGYLAHRYVMHGWGWFLHRSHHEQQLGAFETNDLYLLGLAMVAISLIVLGNGGHEPLQWVGAGVAAFGIIYVVVHDGIVHRYWPLRPRPRNRYLKRLYQAHLLHHAVKGRDNSVSFGFLYAPPLRTLKRQLRESRHRVAGRRALAEQAVESAVRKPIAARLETRPRAGKKQKIVEIPLGPPSRAKG